MDVSELLVQTLINGVLIGGVYAVMMLGFSVIWGVMRVINLAHGEFLMVGAYITWVLNKSYGWEPFVALIVVMPIMFVFGYVIQRILINRVIEKPILISLLVTYGLGIAMASSVKLIYTANPRITETVLTGYWEFGNVVLPVTKTYVLFFALAMMIGLYLLLQRTRFGKSVRAAAQSKESARMVGIEIDKVYALTFAICIALTGAAGMLISPHSSINPFMGTTWTLKAFAITAMSGLGNIPGALMGGMVLGLVENLLATFVPGVGSNIGIISSFVLLVFVLVTRPQGLFGGLKIQQEIQ
ncbi:MAG TPA: branched-chain amino acid ABC transporter permease [Anaerolineales bacterium]|nr:branched-chain amino acid ABC transporter permease [Anaerolineales bacterium]